MPAWRVAGRVLVLRFLRQRFALAGWLLSTGILSGRIRAGNVHRLDLRRCSTDKADGERCAKSKRKE